MSDPGFLLADIPTEIKDRIQEKLILAHPDHLLFRFDTFVRSWTYDRVDFQINYTNLAVQNSAPANLDSSEFTNCASVQADETWQRNKTTQDSASWTNKTGYQFGVDLKIPISIPTAHSEVGATFQYSTETSNTQTQQTDHSWQLTTTIPVPAHAKVQANWYIFEDQFETDYTTVIRPVGMKIVIRFQKLPFFPGQEFTFVVDDFLTSEEQTFQGSGTFKSIEGNRAVISTNESSANCGQQLVTPFERGTLSIESERSVQSLQELAASVNSNEI